MTQPADKRLVTEANGDARYAQVGAAGDGTPDASTSSKVVNGATVTNLATNPAFRATRGVSVLPAPVPVKVGSYNMRLASVTTDTGDKAWTNRKAGFAAIVVASGVSICGLQESSYATVPTKSQAGEAVAAINTQLGATTWKCVGATGTLAIAWNDTVLALDSTPVSVYVNKANTMGSVRCMVWAVFRHRASNTRFIMANTHWENDDSADPDQANAGIRRTESAGIVADELDRARALYNLPAVVTADFNDYDLTSGHPRAVLVARGYRESRSMTSSTVTNGTLNSYNGFDAAMSGKQAGNWMDGIHVSTGFAVAGAGMQVKFASGSSLPLATPLPSDHNMIYASLNITVAPAVTQQGSDEAVATGGGATAYQTIAGSTSLLTVDATGTTSTATGVYVGPAGSSTDGAAQLGLTAGTTYTVGVDCIIPATLGTSSSQYARTILVDAGSTRVVSTAAGTAAGTYRLTATFTADTSTTIRLMHGYTAGLVQWANLTIAKGNTDPGALDGNQAGAWWGTQTKGLSIAQLVASGAIPASVSKALADAVRPWV